MDEDDKLTDEEARLAALRRYEIREPSETKPFQRIVDLVQQVIGVPMAAVSLIDADRQLFKASRGLAITETPRAEAFCNHTIAHKEAFAVSDARLDPRFADNPMVTGSPHIRSYLGVPLTTPDGYNVGSLCASAAWVNARLAECIECGSGRSASPNEGQAPCRSIFVRVAHG